MSNTTGCHTIFHHRYHIVLTPKYRHKVLQGEIRERVRTIVRQVCKEMGVTIVHGILSTNHVHMFAKIPPHITVSRFLQRVKGHSSRKNRSFQHYVNDIGGSVSGPEAISVGPVVTSLTRSYCCTWNGIQKSAKGFQPKLDPTGASR